MKYFDAHCHLQFPQYDADREAVLARMQELGMGAVVVGTDFETSTAGIELAHQHDFLWASVGCHPNDPSTSSGQAIFDTDAFEELAKAPKVVAIGECGLDYFRTGKTDAERAVQKEKFEAHIALAQKLQKPLIIHCRPSAAKAMEGKDAHDDCFVILQKAKIQVPVVMHFFTGTAELAQRYLDLGCYLSFPGPITFTNMYDEAVRVTPLDKILVETDAPFAAPMPHRGKRNEPTYVVEVLKKIAEVKAMNEGEIAEAVLKNAKKIFKLQ